MTLTLYETTLVAVEQGGIVVKMPDYTQSLTETVTLVVDDSAPDLQAGDAIIIEVTDYAS